MPRVKVQLADNIKRVVFINTDATEGATIGKDLRGPDGKVLTVAGLQQLLGGASTQQSSNTGGPSLGSVLTTKGDLATRNSQVQRLGIGAENQALRVSAAGLPEWRSGAALTKTDDTNVTLTLGGAPESALLSAASIEVGWSGTLAQGRGGWGADISAASGYPKFTAGVAAFSGSVPWSDVSSTPTTLAGYGITDAYTKTAVDGMFDDLVDTYLPATYQPLSALLTEFAGLTDAAGVLTNDGSGNLSWAPAFDGDWSSLSGVPAVLTALGGLADAAGVLTNDGSGNLSWGSGGSTYTAGDGLTLAGDEFSVDESFAFDWTGFHTFAGSMQVNGAYGFRIRNASAPANSRNWTWSDPTGSTGALALILVNDAYDNGREAFRATASGFSLASLEYGNSTDLPNHYFYGNFTGNNNTFTGLPAYTGTTTGYSLGRDGTYPAMWTYRGDSGTNEKRWAWYHGLGSSGSMQLLAWADDANYYSAAITFNRSGVVLTSTVFGNTTDRPDQEFYGKLWAYGAPSVDPYHVVAYSPSSTSYMQARSDALNGEVGYTMTNGTRTWYMFHLGADLRFDTGGTKATLGASGEWSWAADVWHKDLAGNNRFYFQNDGRIYFGAPTNDGSVAYEWRNGANAAIAQMRDDGALNLAGSPVPRIVSGGAAGGGRITISTSTPSGTPADGDIWIQRAA